MYRTEYTLTEESHRRGDILRVRRNFEQVPKKKLNTKSSTESEIVGVSNYLPNFIWAKMFLDDQGFIIEENILFQDNQIPIKIK